MERQESDKEHSFSLLPHICRQETEGDTQGRLLGHEKFQEKERTHNCLVFHILGAFLCSLSCVLFFVTPRTV